MSSRQTTARSAKARGVSASKAGNSLGLGAYGADSQRPIVILAFLLPLVVLYELGARFYHEEVVAFSLLRLFAWCLNVYGRGVPAMLLILTLLILHLVRRDRWQVSVFTLLGMLAESILLALPIFIIAMLVYRYIPYLPLAAGSRASLGAMCAISIGAGIYEELVFRLYGCGALRLLTEGLLQLKRPASTIIVVLVSSVLFSVYHYLGNERPTVFSFAFRTAAGAYFAVLFMNRGLGITAAAHAVYDLILVTMQHR